MDKATKQKPEPSRQTAGSLPPTAKTRTGKRVLKGTRPPPSGTRW